MNSYKRTTTAVSASAQRVTPGKVLDLSVSSDTGLASPRTSKRSAAAAWLQSLPAREHADQLDEAPKRRSSRHVDASDLMLCSVETSPNTFVLLNSDHKNGLKRSPYLVSPTHNKALRQSNWSPSNPQSVTASLPPLALPTGSLMELQAEREDSTSPGKKPVHGGPHDWTGTQWLESKVPTVIPVEGSTPTVRAKGPNDLSPKDLAHLDSHHWVETKSGRRAWAEYQLFNDVMAFHPQIVLHVESPASPSLSPRKTPHMSPGNVDSFRASRPRMGSRSNTASSLSRALQQFDLGPAAQDIPEHGTAQTVGPSHPSAPINQSRVVLPLGADERFFNALVNAIRKLLQFLMEQQKDLVRHIEVLRDMIADVASPECNGVDMYEWREVFLLWLECDLFESSREKDRGELSVSATETRFHQYLEELEKQGFLSSHESKLVAGNRLANKMDSWTLQAPPPNNPFKDPRSVQALEHFLRLVMALVSLKRFQRLNIESIRKILKKHGKKTALPASSSISYMAMSPQAHGLLQAASEDAPMPDVDWSQASAGDLLKSLAALAPMSSRAPTQLSMPRILSSLLVKTLLPVLPPVDDYSCLVCTSLAWHPIRLRCGHLFCIRCLVKLQKQGDNHCPLCREIDAVKDADESNYDRRTADYMRLWFPREIEEKTEENKTDRVSQAKTEKKYRRKQRWDRIRGRHTQGDMEHRDCVIS